MGTPKRPGFSASHPWLSAILLVVITSVLGVASLGVETQYEMEDFFAADTPERRSYDRYRASFGRDDATALVLLETNDPLGVGGLRHIHDLTQRLESRSDVTHVVSPTNVRVPRRDSAGVPHLEPAFTRAVLDDPQAASARLAQMRGFYARRPWRDNILSADGRVAVVTVRLAPTHLSTRHRTALTRALEEEKRALTQAGFQVRLAGYPVHRVYFSEHIGSESNRLTPIVLAVIALLLGLIFRSVVGVVLPLLVASLSVVWTFGLMSLLGIPANALAPALLILVLLVSVTDSVHFVSTWRQHLADGVPPQKTPATALAALFRPCLLTSLTTAMVFAGLQLTGIPLIGQFGLGVAVGVMGAFVVCVLVAPILLTLAVRRTTPVTGTPPQTRTARALERLDSLVARHPWKIVIGTAAAATLLAFGATQVRVNSPLLADLQDDHPIQQTNRFIEQRLGGLIPLDLVLRAPSKQADAMYEGAFIQRVAELASRLRAIPEVLGVTSVADVLDGLRPLIEQVPQEQAYSLAPAALLLANDQMSHWVDLATNTQRIRLRTRNLDTAAALRLFETIRGHYEQVMGHPAPEDLLTGQGYLGQHINLQLVDHFRWSFLVGVLLVLLAVLIAFRRLGLALVALPSNLLPLLVVAGVMGFAGIELRYTSALVLSVSFGLAIDDTIHMLAQVSAQRGALDPIARGGRAAGSGMLWTSVVLAVGLSVLTASSFVPNQVLGALLALTAVAALHGDLVLLPALLRLVSRRRGRGAAQPPLVGVEVPVAELDLMVRRQLFAIFQQVYDGVDEPRFYADLGAKDSVILLRVRGIGPIHGFSTFSVFQPPVGAGHRGRPARILYSGDTAIDPRFWGQRELSRAFGRLLARLRWTSRGSLYWLLSSKGYKTYLLLTNYFPMSWPRHDMTMDATVRQLRDQLGRHLYGEAYDPKTGVAGLQGSRDRVRPDLAPVTAQEETHPDIRFFVQANPGHAAGDELVCLARIRYREPLRAYARIIARSLGLKGASRRGSDA